MDFGRKLICFVLFSLGAISPAFSAQPPVPGDQAALTKAQVEEKLHTTGLTGVIHGAISNRNLYVFTVTLPPPGGPRFRGSPRYGAHLEGP